MVRSPETKCSLAQSYGFQPEVPRIGPYPVAEAAWEAYHSRKIWRRDPQLSLAKARRGDEEIIGYVVYGGPWYRWFPDHAVSRPANRAGVARACAEDCCVLGNVGLHQDRAVLRRRCRPDLFRPCPTEVQQLGRVSRGGPERPLRTKHEHQAQSERRPARAFTRQSGMGNVQSAWGHQQRARRNDAPLRPLDHGS